MFLIQMLLGVGRSGNESFLEFSFLNIDSLVRKCFARKIILGGVLQSLVKWLLKSNPIFCSHTIAHLTTSPPRFFFFFHLISRSWRFLKGCYVKTGY